MKLFFTIMVAIVLSWDVVADTWTDPNTGIVWTYQSCNDEVIVGGYHNTPAVPTSTIGDLAIPSTLNNLPVTSVGYCAFRKCCGLSSVSIPDSVTNIDACAFEDCSGLTRMSIPSNVINIGESAFAYCSSLMSLTIPSSVMSIGNWSFAGCSGLGDGVIIVNGCVLNVNGTCPTEVELPDGVRLIAGGAFSYCSSLVSVAIPTSVASIGDYAFYACSGLLNVSIPSSVKEIGKGAFKDSGLLSMSIQEGVSYLGNESFMNCDGLKSALIPSSVKSVGDNAFYHCSGLQNVKISEGVASIGVEAFHYCSEMSSLSIPASVTSIGGYAFGGCDGLGSGVVIVDDCLLTVKYGTCPATVDIPNGVRLIVGGAFSSCRELTSVSIPSSVKSIGEHSFFDCDGLTSVTIPYGVNALGDEAFMWCDGLEKVVISSSVTNIGRRAFWGCESLASIDFEGAPPIGLSSASVNQNVAIRYNVEYESEWLPVIAECGYTNASPYTPPKSDGGPYAETVEGIEWSFMVTNLESVVMGASSVAGKVTIPPTLGGRSVKKIGFGAFNWCEDITSVTIPASVRIIDEDAFECCLSLSDVYFEGTTIDRIGWYAFDYCYWDLIMHVPADWQGRGRTIAGYTVWRGDSSDVEKCVNMTVTNVVVQYVLNSIQPEIAVPVSNSVGFVNIITEVASSGAVSVPTEWKTNYPTFETKFGTDFGKALSLKTGKKDGAGNDMFVWQDFVAGTDPTDENDQFTASITIVDGVPVISYTPELTPEQAALRVYKTYGKMKLTDTAWTDITAKTSEERAAYNFFKVTVEMK